MVARQNHCVAWHQRHRYHKILALCNIKAELTSSFFLNTACSQYFLVLMQWLINIALHTCNGSCEMQKNETMSKAAGSYSQNVECTFRACGRLSAKRMKHARSYSLMRDFKIHMTSPSRIWPLSSLVMWQFSVWVDTTSGEQKKTNSKLNSILNFECENKRAKLEKKPIVFWAWIPKVKIVLFSSFIIHGLPVAQVAKFRRVNPAKVCML